MAGAASRATTLTTLVVGRVEMAVGLFASRDKPGKLAQFDTAGPHGGVLEAREIARPVPVAETVDLPDVPVHSDPLLVDPEGQRCPGCGSTHPNRHEEGCVAVAMAGDPGPDPAVAAAAIGEMLDHAPPARPSAVAGEYGRELVEHGSGDVVLPQDVRRGVRLEDGRFIDCTAQLAAISERTKLDRMEVVAFIDSTRVPRALISNAYYLGAADEKAPKPMRLIWEAMKARRRVAVVKLTKKSRQTLGVIAPVGPTLMLLECVWAEDRREPPAKALAIQKAEVFPHEVSMAVKLVDAMADGTLAMDELRDDAIALREELHARALAGEVPEVLVPEAAPMPSDDLEALLEASLAAVA